MKKQTSDHRSPTSTKRRPRVLALSSGGGHWVQLLRLRPAFKDCDITYATVSKGYESEVEGAKFRVIVDSNRDQKLKLILSFFSIACLILKERPHAILSTGAAPGFFALFIGKLLGKKTIWVDSIANAEELSMSGQKAGKYATHWLTQWEHLAKPEGPHYYGNVLGDDSEYRAQKSKIAPHNPTEEQFTPISNSQSSIHNRRSRIFVTVGTDQHFDRMVKIVDRWAANNPTHEIFAQIGEADYQPTHLKYSKFLTPQEFIEHVKSSSLIIAHAGIGTIIISLTHQKPTLVMPKLASLGENRNEHQTATAKYLSRQVELNVVFDEHDLVVALNHLGSISSDSTIGRFAGHLLTIKLSSFILS